MGKNMVEQKKISTFLAKRIFKGNLLTNKNNYKNERELRLITLVEFPLVKEGPKQKET